jgi:hypothetical protein
MRLTHIRHTDAGQIFQHSLEGHRLAGAGGYYRIDMKGFTGAFDGQFVGHLFGHRCAASEKEKYQAGNDEIRP